MCVPQVPFPFRPRLMMLHSIQSSSSECHPVFHHHQGSLTKPCFDQRSSYRWLGHPWLVPQSVLSLVLGPLPLHVPSDQDLPLLCDSRRLPRQGNIPLARGVGPRSRAYPAGARRRRVRRGLVGQLQVVARGHQALDVRNDVHVQHLPFLWFVLEVLFLAALLKLCCALQSSPTSARSFWRPWATASATRSFSCV